MERTMTYLCKKSDVPENGTLRVVIAGSEPLAVYNLDGRFFATEDRCSHGEAFLSEGFIEEGLIVCPFHFGSFDIRTGKPVGAPCTREIAIFKVAERGDDLLIETE